MTSSSVTPLKRKKTQVSLHPETMSTVLRKRPASFQAGPVPKKVHLDKTLKGTPKKEKAEKKRSRPITMPLGDASDESDVDTKGEFTSDSEDEVKERDMVVAGGAVHAREPNGMSRDIYILDSYNQRGLIRPQLPMNHTNHKRLYTLRDVLQSPIQSYFLMPNAFGHLCVKRTFQRRTDKSTSRN